MGNLVFVLVAMTGASFASFFTLFLERRECGEDWIFKKSHCNECGETIPRIYLIPIFGYFFARGRCSCGFSIPIRYLVVEIFAAIVTGFEIYFVVSSNFPYSFGYILFFAFLLYLAIEDYLFHEVYTKELIALCVWGIVVAFLNDSLFIRSGVFIFVLLGAVHLIFKRGFGEGDVYYGSLLALFLPDIWKSYLFFTASVSLAAIAGATTYALGRLKDRELPLFPFFLLGWVLIHYFSK